MLVTIDAIEIDHLSLVIFTGLMIWLNSICFLIWLPNSIWLHGFPELWYTWHHQIAAFAALGYRAVAPDLRGFGDTDAPADPSSYMFHHVVGDVVALIESLDGGGVFVVGHD